MPDRERLRRRLEEQTARDHTRMRHWSRQREARVTNQMERPLTHGLCRVCLVGMIAGALAAGIGDLASGSPRAVPNAAASALMMWLIFGVPLSVACQIQLRRGFDHPWFDAHRLTRRGNPRMPWDKKYRLWLLIDGIGTCLLGIAFALTR